MGVNVCIVGAGAVGGVIGARLGTTGARISALARGATLDALRARGFRVQGAEGPLSAPAVASDRAEDLGPQDLVVLAVKSPALPAVAATLAPLLGPETVVMPAMNGVPFWFCHGLPGFDAPLESVDPGGVVGRAIAFDRILGCVVHFSASRLGPGLARHDAGRRLVVGEPRGGRTARCEAVVDLLARAGFEVTRSSDVRQDIWYKLWGNMTMNPVSALTGATTDRVLADPLVRALCSAAMREAAEIGSRVGCTIQEDAEDRHRVTSKLGVFKTSMLQDAEAGRPIELDAIVGAVREIGLRVGCPVPYTSALLGLARLFGRVHGLYPNP